MSEEARSPEKPEVVPRAAGGWHRHDVYASLGSPEHLSAVMSKAYDELQLRVDPALYIHWPGGGGFQQVELLVNGQGLIDLVRAAELPHASREYDERVAAGDSPDDLGPRGSLAGSYLYLPPTQVFLPSRNLLGAPWHHGFETDEEDPRSRKSLLLSCTCGVTDCWFLLADITVAHDTVTWSGFCQFHRSWDYSLGPFVFAREEYERRLRPEPAG